MLSHLDAKSLLELVDPTLSPAERLVAQAVSLHESSYGAGWKPGHGEGSHNWGAIMRPTGDAGPFFETGDSRPGSSEVAPVGFVGHFKIYPDDAEGAHDVIRVALKDNVRAAARAGSLRGVAQAMHANGYYTGISTSPSVNVLRYEAALRQALDKILASTGEENPFPKASAPLPAQSGSPLPASSGGSLPTLRPGDVGPAVSLLRGILEKLDWGSMLPAGDKYDAATARAVGLFQGVSGLTQDHVVGQKTWAALAARLSEPGMVGYT